MGSLMLVRYPWSMAAGRTILKRPRHEPEWSISLVVACAESLLNPGLLRNPSGNQLAGVDERKRLGMVAALEIDRLVLGAIDMNHLARVQADPNASR
jgi:hypothetical protein